MDEFPYPPWRLTAQEPVRERSGALAWGDSATPRRTSEGSGSPRPSSNAWDTQGVPSDRSERRSSASAARRVDSINLKCAAAVVRTIALIGRPALGGPSPWATKDRSAGANAGRPLCHHERSGELVNCQVHCFGDLRITGSRPVGCPRIGALVLLTWAAGRREHLHTIPSMGTVIQPVAADDQPRVIATLVSAFIADPVERWLYPEPFEYLTQFPAFAAAFGGAAFERETVWSVADFAAVAMWLLQEREPS